MRHNAVMVVVMLSIATLASSAAAHHSHPFFYDECKIITIEGRVERIDFKEPHSWIILTLDDGTAYNVDWASPSALTRDGIIGPAKEALVPGARVVVTGNRIRTLAQIQQHFPDFTSNVNPNTVDPVSIRRVGGSFSWALPPRTNPPSCDGK